MHTAQFLPRFAPSKIYTALLSVFVVVVIGCKGDDDQGYGGPESEGMCRRQCEEGEVFFNGCCVAQQFACQQVKLLASPRFIDFGYRREDENGPRHLRLHNVGNCDLEITTVQFGPNYRYFKVDLPNSDGSPIRLRPPYDEPEPSCPESPEEFEPDKLCDSVTVGVTFDENEDSSEHLEKDRLLEDVLTVTYRPRHTGGSKRIQVRVTIRKPYIVADVPETTEDGEPLVDFGYMPLNRSKTQSILLLNMGAGPEPVRFYAELDQSENTPFEFIEPPRMRFEANQKHLIVQVRYHPTSPMNDSATLTIGPEPKNDNLSANMRIVLQGTSLPRN